MGKRERAAGGPEEQVRVKAARADFWQRHEWRQGDGAAIAVTDMTDSHLLATVRMLRRNAPQVKRSALVYRAFAGLHEDDGIQHRLQREWDELEVAHPLAVLQALPLYRGMIEEVGQRGLGLEPIGDIPAGEFYDPWIADFVLRAGLKTLELPIPSRAALAGMGVG